MPAEVTFGTGSFFRAHLDRRRVFPRVFFSILSVADLVLSAKLSLSKRDIGSLSVCCNVFTQWLTSGDNRRLHEIPEGRRRPLFVGQPDWAPFLASFFFFSSQIFTFAFDETFSPLTFLDLRSAISQPSILPFSERRRSFYRSVFRA